MTGPYRTPLVGELLTEEKLRLIEQCFFVTEMTEDKITILGKRTPGDGIRFTWSAIGMLVIQLGTVTACFLVIPPSVFGFHIANGALILLILRSIIRTWPSRPLLIFRRGSYLAQVSRETVSYEVPFPLFSEITPDRGLVVAGIILRHRRRTRDLLFNASEALGQFTAHQHGSSLSASVQPGLSPDDCRKVGGTLLLTKTTPETMEFQAFAGFDPSDLALFPIAFEWVFLLLFGLFVLYLSEQDTARHWFLAFVLPNISIVLTAFLNERVTAGLKKSIRFERVVLFRGMRTASFKDEFTLARIHELTSEGIALKVADETSLQWIKVKTPTVSSTIVDRYFGSVYLYPSVEALQRYVGQAS